MSLLVPLALVAAMLGAGPAPAAVATSAPAGALTSNDCPATVTLGGVTYSGVKIDGINDQLTTRTVQSRTCRPGNR